MYRGADYFVHIELVHQHADGRDVGYRILGTDFVEMYVIDWTVVGVCFGFGYQAVYFHDVILHIIIYIKKIYDKAYLFDSGVMVMPVAVFMFMMMVMFFMVMIMFMLVVMFFEVVMVIVLMIMSVHIFAFFFTVYQH